MFFRPISISRIPAFSSFVPRRSRGERRERVLNKNLGAFQEGFSIL
jgi:hypothetical protein